MNTRESINREFAHIQRKAQTLTFTRPKNMPLSTLDYEEDQSTDRSYPTLPDVILRSSSWTTPQRKMTTPSYHNSPMAGGAFSPQNRGLSSHTYERGSLRVKRRNGGGRSGGANTSPTGSSSSVSCSSPPPSLNLVTCQGGTSLLFSETNLDWSKLNIFRTRMCDRLTQTRTCHMANRCLFSHEMQWPRRTPFLPRASALTLRYIPVWCPRIKWPGIRGVCDSSGKISWTTEAINYQACPRGENCPFVHSVEEFLYHPEIYKSRLCCLVNDDHSAAPNSGQNSVALCPSSVALCPWYFCPFAHDAFELRDLSSSKYTWYLPPQIVDNQFVARTQSFDALELSIIDYVRKAPHGVTDIYVPHSFTRLLARGGGGASSSFDRSSLEQHLMNGNANSNLQPTECGALGGSMLSSSSAIEAFAFKKLPPVLYPATGSSLEGLTSSDNHRTGSFDDVLYLMVTMSFLNLLLYPVENFYVPALLSLQCAVLQYQLNINPSVIPLEAAHLVSQFNRWVVSSVSDGTNTCNINGMNINANANANANSNNSLPLSPQAPALPQLMAHQRHDEEELFNAELNLINTGDQEGGSTPSTAKSPTAASDGHVFAGGLLKFADDDNLHLHDGGAGSSNTNADLDMQSLLDLLQCDDIMSLINKA